MSGALRPYYDHSNTSMTGSGYVYETRLVEPNPISRPGVYVETLVKVPVVKQSTPQEVLARQQPHLVLHQQRTPQPQIILHGQPTPQIIHIQRPPQPVVYVQPNPQVHLLHHGYGIGTVYLARR